MEERLPITDGWFILEGPIQMDDNWGPTPMTQDTSMQQVGLLGCFSIIMDHRFLFLRVIPGIVQERAVFHSESSRGFLFKHVFKNMVLLFKLKG